VLFKGKYKIIILLLWESCADRTMRNRVEKGLQVVRGKVPHPERINPRIFLNPGPCWGVADTMACRHFRGLVSSFSVASSQKSISAHGLKEDDADCILLLEVLANRNDLWCVKNDLPN
jgi:hypothetical protein